MFRKKNEEQLDSQTASQLLENVFDSANMEPSSVPFETMVSAEGRRRDRFLVQKALLVIAVILLCFLPILLITPNFTLLELTGEGPGKYEVSVDGFLPVDSVDAGVDGHVVPVTRTGDRTYLVEPDVNGTLEVTVTLFNRHSVSKSITVSSLDTAPPQVIRDEGDDSFIYITLTDDRSGVDFEGIFAIDANRNVVDPVSFDAQTGVVAFAYPESMLNIFIPDKNGNTLQIVITI